jgi:hypothetical protein
VTPPSSLQVRWTVASLMDLADAATVGSAHADAEQEGAASFGGADGGDVLAVHFGR